MPRTRTKPESVLAWVLSRAWRPRPRLSTPQWVGENVRLPGAFGNPGRFDLDDFPYWREPLEALDDPETFEIVLQAATQVGKTETLKAMLVAQSDVDPCPMMLVGPDKDFISELRDKIYAGAEINPALRDRIPDKQGRNMRWLDFGQAYCYLAWVGNTQRVSGKAVKVVFCTEVDRYAQAKSEGEITKLISERVKSFARYKLIFESTPTDDASLICALYDASDRRTYRVPCLHCGTYQELRFFPHKSGPHKGRGGVVGMQDSKGNWLKPEQALEAAYYVCLRGCRIESHEKPEMVSRGVWCPKGQDVNKRGKLTGTPERGGRIRGYQFGSIYARVVPFGRIAEEWVRSRDKPAQVKNFFNNWLGLRHSTATKTPQWMLVGRQLAGHYHRGTVPSAAWFLTAGVDVQEDRCYWSVRAWGAHAASWLVDWGVCHKIVDEHGRERANSDLKQLDAVLIDRKWNVNGRTAEGYGELWAATICIDTGHRIHDVHQFLRERPGTRLRAVAGDQAVRDTFYRCRTLEKNSRTGKAYEGGLRQWQLNVDAYKDDLRDRWSLAAGEPGTWLLPATVVDEGEEYLRMICNEVPEVVETSTGQRVRRWVAKGDNHYWDTEVYARAGADFVTEGDWVPDHEKPAVPEPEPAAERPGVVRRGHKIRSRGE